MGRNRVLSFIAQFSAPHRDSRTPTPPTTTSSTPKRESFHNKASLAKQHARTDSVDSPQSAVVQRDLASDVPSASSAATTPPSESEHATTPTSLDNSPSSSPARRSKRSSRPLSMVQTYHPPVMAVNEQTLPELQPIFTLLNSHSNKLYQEGYFLKLDDQDIRGHPNPDRTWTECFAQLVGTVLSLWDAAELDAAGEDGEVLPKFINLTDASIKMLESLPTKTNDEQPLQNILSISTAGRNRYLLHFNSHHSLIQWTSGIRLAIYEHSTLQEAYTGALIAGKGKTLNNINIIMERARQPIAEWVRVRFGAGVPWKRCYCVIEPPSEKEYQKAQKEAKKRSPYDRSHGPIVKGDIRFYDTKKDAEKKKKHQRPIATITDAYSAYAIYPQAKELIDSSTLLKVEGNITIHTEPASSSEGFVFIMPETPPAVSGFEILLRFLFPTWDTFALYGRPGRLVASSLDSRSLMFAMPKNKRYGYLDLLDVSGLILTDGSGSWSEREWRKRLKELTGQRMNTMEEAAGSQSRSTSRNSKRLSYGNQNSGSRPRVGFADDSGSARSSRSMSVSRPGVRTDSAPPDPNRERAPSAMAGVSRHSRHISDTQIGDFPPSSGFDNSPPAQAPLRTGPDRVRAYASDLASTPERVSSEDDSPIRGPFAGHIDGMKRMETPEPVNAPPAFAHSAGSRPQQRPSPSPEMRRANNRLSNTTLSQLARASGLIPDSFADDLNGLHPEDESAGHGPRRTDQGGLSVQPQLSANIVGMNANSNGSREVVTSPTSASDAPPPPPLKDPFRKRSNSPLRGPPANSAGNPPPQFRPNPHGGPPHGGRRTPPPGSNQSQLSSPVAGGSPPVQRKALPLRTTSLPRDHQDATSPTSTQSSPRSYPSPASGPHFQSLDQFTPPVPQTQYGRNGQRNAEDGRDDASSTASPDYASTRRSTETQESVDRPRAGVLKVVGNAAEGPADKEYDIPEINFGPTLNYGAPILPVSKASSKESPRKSPGSQKPFPHTRQQSDDTVRRSVVWPGPCPGSSSTDNLASALQPRTVPVQYAHQRSPSTSTLTDYKASHSRHSSADLLSTKRPSSQSHSRHSSVDLLSSGRPSSRGAEDIQSRGEPSKRPGTRGGLHSRSNSADLLASKRPPSQGTAAALSAGELSSSLSAREQEHVARVTGSPLIALAGGKGPSQTQSGLVGAIDARERERVQMRQGISGQAVAQAIDQRHREQNQQAQRAAQAAYAQQQAHFAAQQAGPVRPQTPGGRGMMMGGGGMPSPYGPQGPARPQTPGARGMMDGGGPLPYPPSMGGMNPRSMSPGPNMRSPPGPMGPPPPLGMVRQPRPHMMSHGPPYGGDGPAGPGRNMGNMPPHRQGTPGPMMSPPPPMMSPPPSVGFGMQQGPHPQSPGFQLPPQGQYARPGTPGGPPRPGTPGRMQFHGQAF
ncbi:hypothetical protein C7999DRAFT_38541 [Corynascus novoguineensis]|uniref:PH domain-containing protein n=1 Tax=Corynascus novoguineensis TaxID=1126955 RepID=A0AAN7CY23_9PEZI|nr:hypothetical protein C7999DRAFT_38541 [Corynascus novoguineensis]